MTIRPALRPGAAVLRRDPHHLQIGTSPGVVVADRPGLLGLLLSLDGRRGLDELPPVVRELLAAGAVVDLADWQPHAPAESRAAALADRAEEVTGRAARSVSVHADSGTRPFAAVVRSLLRASGVVQLADDVPDLLVVVSTGEPARHVYADAAARQQPHLPVRLDEDRVLIGPTVVPGHSPCVGCHDLHRVQWDPAWAALMTQFGARSPHHNPPAPTTLTAHAGAVETVGLVLDHLAGRRAGQGAVVAVGPHHRERDVWPVAFHPRCTCSLLAVHRSSA